MKDIKDFKQFCNENKNNLVVVSQNANGDVCFWTGTNWSCEYPDAALYNKSDAKSVFVKTKAKAVIQNYGTDKEWTVYSSLD
jgi:hypothetical protein